MGRGLIYFGLSRRHKPSLLRFVIANVYSQAEERNNIRLNSATGYITAQEMLAGRQQDIHAERDRKLEAARKQLQIRRQEAA